MNKKIFGYDPYDEHSWTVYVTIKTEYLKKHITSLIDHVTFEMLEDFKFPDPIISVNPLSIEEIC